MKRFAKIWSLHVLPLIAAMFVGVSAFEGCTIEPPLHMPTLSDGYVTLGEVITDLNVIFDDSLWQEKWWYGWDSIDQKNWGEIGYTLPSSYEGRFYYLGEDAAADYKSMDKLTLFETRFRRTFDFGYHNMLLWSHIVSNDGTQVVTIDETDPSRIFASTSRTHLSYRPMPSRSGDVYNNPETFFSATLNKLYISRDTADYDYYDIERNAWVKTFHTKFHPLVYIYLVQVAIYNNHGRIVGVNDNPAINSLADGVVLQTGHTSDNPVVVTYQMRLKHNLPARNGRIADILGGRLTTFGLCDMTQWRGESRSPVYAGSRMELQNHLSLNLKFSNTSDSVYHYNVTNQMQRYSRGGVITIEIDADTLVIPKGKGSGGTFNPVIPPVDTIVVNFEV